MPYEPPDSGNNAYLAAIADVNSTIRFMTDTATTFLGVTTDAIHALGSWTPPPEGTPPVITVTPIVPNPLPDLPPPDANLFGEVGELVIPAWEDFTNLVNDFNLDDPGPFHPHTLVPTTPPPPTPIDTSGAPVRPPINPVDIPPDPDLQLPPPDALIPIDLPPRPVIVVPPFDVEDIPTFDEVPPPLVLNWHESSYQPLVGNEVAATIKLMLAGGFSMPAVVQEALWAAARDREDIVARQNLEAAVDDWAGRGFDMPPGMLVEQVNALRDANQLKANTLSRTVFTQAAQWAVENLRAAVVQGVAMEGVWTQLWNNIQQRAFEAAHLVVELAKDRFNLLATAYNLRIASVRIKLEVFEARLKAELAKLDILRAEIEVEKLKGTINEQSVRIYTARIDGLRMLAQVFSEKMNAAKIRSDIELSKIVVYKTDVEAWSTRITGDMARFTAYDSQVRGIEATSRTYEAESHAYSATVQAASDRNAARNRVIDSKMHALEIGTSKFLGLLQGNMGTVTANREAIAARAQSWGAGVTYSSERMKYKAQNEEIRIRAQEGSVRNNLAYFDTLSRQFDSRMTRLLQQGTAIRDAINGAGAMAAQMAAGAMSAIHAQATVSGSGSNQASWQYYTDLTPR